MGKKAYLVLLSTLVACGGDATGPGSGSPGVDAATDGGGAGDSTLPGTEGGAGPDGAAPLDATATTTTGDAAGLDGSRDAAVADASLDAAAGDAAPFIADCLPDGTGHLNLTTTGALSLDVQLGNNAYCTGGGTATKVGYTFEYDTVWQPGGSQHVLVNVIVPTGSRDQTGTASVSVQIQTYTNPDLSDAQQWIGPCTANITTNTQYASNNVYLSYKIGGIVTCASPLPNKTLDGGAGSGASLTVSKLDLMTGVIFGL
jgi:hypothetical protein